MDVNPTLTRPGCVHGTGWDILWATFWRQSSQHRTRRVIGERAGCRGDRRLGSLPGIAKEGGLGASVNKIRMWKEIRFAGDGEGGREERRRTAEAANARGARRVLATVRRGRRPTLHPSQGDIAGPRTVRECGGRSPNFSSDARRSHGKSERGTDTVRFPWVVRVSPEPIPAPWGRWQSSTVEHVTGAQARRRWLDHGGRRVSAGALDAWLFWR